MVSVVGMEGLKKAVLRLGPIQIKNPIPKDSKVALHLVH
jgi:hypothetical protein